MSIFTTLVDTTPPVLAITSFTPNSDSTTTISGTIDLADAGQTISLYADGTLTKWLQQVTDFFSATGNIPNPVPASRYFDSSIYLDTIEA